MDNTQKEEYLDLTNVEDQGMDSDLDFETGLEGLEMPMFEMNFDDIPKFTSI